jgi:hypothetical protein
MVDSSVKDTIRVSTIGARHKSVYNETKAYKKVLEIVNLFIITSNPGKS